MNKFINVYKSYDSIVVDEEDNEYIDCFGQYGSMVVGWNNKEIFSKYHDLLTMVALHKIANSSVHTDIQDMFRETFATITEGFDYRFFIDGGSAAVENALKIAFDWKGGSNPDIVHIDNSFHGLGGYAMSLTSCSKSQTEGFPKFNWTRIMSPAFNMEQSIHELKHALRTKNVAAIICEPIQSKGGDIYFPREFFETIRLLSYQHEALLIFDEIQTGFGATGEWWYHKYLDVQPDILVFGKKAQVSGLAATNRINKGFANSFKTEYRLDSTTGGNIVDMVRSAIYIDYIERHGLLKSLMDISMYFFVRLHEINNIEDIRGIGMLLAFSLKDNKSRNEYFNRLTERVWALKCGQRSIRFRPPLTFSKEDVDEVIKHMKTIT
jgi:L-lysine 6-transaminase